MKIACIQLSSGENYQNNFKDIIKYVNQAIKNKSDLIITPETSSLMSSSREILFKFSFEMNKDPILKKIREVSKNIRNGFYSDQFVLRLKINSEIDLYWLDQMEKLSNITTRLICLMLKFQIKNNIKKVKLLKQEIN